MLKLFSLVLIALSIIVTIILVKYKPVYKVIISGQEAGYIEDKEEFENTINNELFSDDNYDVAYVTLNNDLSYEHKLVDRSQELKTEEILQEIKDEATVTYRMYAVTFNGENEGYVNSLEEATKIIDNIKAEYEQDLELDLIVEEKYVDSLENIEETTVEVAMADLSNQIETIIEEEKATSINGVKIAFTPVEGRITSRFGERSARRVSTHTGLDIACSTGTDIQVIEDGVVTFSGTDGSYGKVVKISHGNGVETWYAHCSALYVKTNQTVSKGDVIAAVGSTGNSSGPHLHLEIRVNGTAINPQLYLYK